VVVWARPFMPSRGWRRLPCNPGRAILYRGTLTTGGSSGQGDRCAGHHLAGTTPSCLSGYRLGSTQSVADSAGNEVGRAIYTPFGEPIVNTIPPQVTNRLFTGQRWDDPVGLYDYNARFYDPQIGQFTQPDPFIDGDTAIGWNRYAYAHNAPTVHVDPSGHSVWDLLDVGQFIYSLSAFLERPGYDTLGGLALDTVGLLPLIPPVGALKYADEATDLARAADVAEDVGGGGAGLLGRSGSAMARSNHWPVRCGTRCGAMCWGFRWLSRHF
jgi:RHS repeat-associated protein